MPTTPGLGIAVRRIPAASALAVASAVAFALIVAVSGVDAAPRELRALSGAKQAVSSRGTCTADADCVDHTVCTTDRCDNGTCVHTPVPDCVACDPIASCPPLDVVFLLDTSGSMGDEAAALCTKMAQIVSDLTAEGIIVYPHFLGISETPGGPFSCLSNDVVSLLGGDVPGTMNTCPFPQPLSAFESWGPATAIVAERFAWNAGTKHVIIPISDEGPCNGDLPDGCNDPGDDRDSVSNAIEVANNNDVIVSPITGTGASLCVQKLAADLAAGTGGTTFQSQDPGSDLVESIADMLRQLCDDATTCNDGDICTVDDRCDLSGQCLGVPLDQIACTSDDDCFGSPCDLAQGFCECVEQPELCVETVNAAIPDGTCFIEGQEFRVNIVLGKSSHLVSGGQFQIRYDPSLLEFIDVKPGVVYDPESPFTMSVGKLINTTTGRVFYAVVTNFGHPGTHGPAVMATMRFRAIAACATTDICYLDENPRVTILSDSDGDTIPFIPCCTGDFSLVKGPPTINCPSDVSMDVEAGSLSRFVSWSPVVADDACDGALPVDCVAENSLGLSLDGLAQTGGLFPASTTIFTCSTSSTCGLEDACTWTVDIAETSPFKVDVQLAPTMAAGPIERCIEFAFYSSCIEKPVVVSHTLRFGRPFDLPGFARNVAMDIPAGSYECVTARDPMHTLRSVADLSVESGRYIARFTGDPSLAGNWLIGGNLNGDHVIDALDYAALMTVWLPPDPVSIDPNVRCEEVGIHGDINGDGTIDSFDADVIERNWLLEDEPSCCSEDVGPPGIIRIPVNLLGPGLGWRLAEADFNFDGYIDLDEIKLILEQGLPSLTKQAARPSHILGP
ncbi:MAG: hypothetical protein J5J06_10480 [Phycisphaerae bacterium]|nr:hypothetical protein [Phycisphaerae bacterium]